MWGYFRIPSYLSWVHLKERKPPFMSLMSLTEKQHCTMSSHLILWFSIAFIKTELRVKQHVRHNRLPQNLHLMAPEALAPLGHWCTALQSCSSRFPAVKEKAWRTLFPPIVVMAHCECQLCTRHYTDYSQLLSHLTGQLSSWPHHLYFMNQETVALQSEIPCSG